MWDAYIEKTNADNNRGGVSQGISGYLKINKIF